MNSERSIQAKFAVKLIPAALQDLNELDGSVKKKVLAQLVKIGENPLTGESLGNKMGMNLTGYRKIYVDKKRIRIVWRVEHKRVTVVVMGIGPRDKGEIYKEILVRLDQLKDSGILP